MISKNFKLKGNERKTKKAWLLSLWIVTMGLPFLEYIAFSVQYMMTTPSGMIDATIMTVLMMLFILPLPCTLYHCAYKKNGTLLLTWFLLGTICSIFQDVWNILIDPLDVLTVFKTISILGSFWMGWICLKLRAVNKRLQFESLEPEYISSLSLLTKAKSIEELDKYYFEIVQQWPQLEYFTSKEYKLIKCL